MTATLKILLCVFKIASLNSFERKHSYEVSTQYISWANFNTYKRIYNWQPFINRVYLTQTQHNDNGQGLNPDLSVRENVRYVWVIDPASWILGNFFFLRVHRPSGVEVHELAKRERSQYAAILTEKAWPIMNLLFGFGGHFSRGTRRVVPSWQSSPILTARVASHSARFCLSCPLKELAM